MRTSFRSLATVTLAIAGSAAGAAAQELEPRPWTFGVAVGATVPVGDLGDFAGLGFHVRGGVAWERPTMALGFRGELGYANLSGKTINVGTTAIDGPDTRILSLLANGTWAFRQAQVVDDGQDRGYPYAIAGLGVYDFDFDEEGISGAGGGTTDFGINAGAGWRFRLVGLRMHAEARFHYVFSDEPTNFIPFSLGIWF
jgi:hypothetical protein